METVATMVPFHATPDEVWAALQTYEEVDVTPPFLLRTFLPRPLRTEGDKMRVGASILCSYSSGDLQKRITKVEPPHMLAFDVTQQNIGIEDWIVAIGGSYWIESGVEQTEVVLTTQYIAYLEPRAVWRRVEAVMAHRFHRHILKGMAASLRIAREQQPALQHSGS